MRALLRLVSKELLELMVNSRTLVMLIILPPLILSLVGYVRLGPPEVNLLVSGVGDCTFGESVDETVRTSFRFLSQLDRTELTCQAETDPDPLGTLEAGRFDLILNINDRIEDRWVVYLDDTNPRRTFWHLQLAKGIQMSRREFESADPELTAIFKLSSLGAISLQSAQVYYPQAAKYSLALLPGIFGLIVCFLPFVISTPSLIREREEHTLEVLLSAPGVNGRTVFASKCLTAILVGLISALLMMLTLQVASFVFVKPDVMLFVPFLILPMLSSSLLGLTSSSLARNQTQTLMSAALYFVCLMLFSGYLYPLEGSTQWVQYLAQLLPLTHLVDPANAWMFGADFTSNIKGPLTILLLQCVVYGLIALASWRWRLRRI